MQLDNLPIECGRKKMHQQSVHQHMYEFPIAAITKLSKVSDLKHHKLLLIVLEFETSQLVSWD